MEQHARAIEQRIRDQRSQLDRNITALEAEVRSMVDWKTQYAKHAAGALGVAAAGGFLLGALSAPDRPRQSDARRVRRDVREVAATAGSRPGPGQRAAVAFVDTRDQVVEALLKLASVKVIEVIGRFVPGFGEELTRTQGGSIRGLEAPRA